MWALALLPTLAHARAFGAGDGTHWLEVCTPQGVRWVAVADSATPGAADLPAPPVSVAGHLEHCPWCPPAHADCPVLPVPRASFAVAPAGAGKPGLRFVQAQPAAPPWRPAQPRAPPTRS